MFERSANLFPGFDYEIQGLYKQWNGDAKMRLYTYVVQE